MANINKNIIMQAGAAVANATNKAAGLSASTPEPGSIISAIQLVNGGRTIGPAALAHFTESVRNKLLSLLVDMKPIQDLHGYSKPWPAGGWKNLVDVESPQTITSQTELAIYVTSEQTTFTVSATIKNNVAIAGSLNILLFNGNSYVRYASVNVPASADSARYSCTIDCSNTVYDNMRISISGQSAGYNLTVSDVQLEKGSTATSYAPYANICPISDRTWLAIYAGPTSEIGDAATYVMDWTSPAGTVYAGSADIVTGDIKAAPYYASYNGETLVGPWVSSMDEYDPEGTPTTGAQVVDLGGTITEYHITGQDIITLVGDNYIWSDSGDVTITE